MTVQDEVVEVMADALKTDLGRQSNARPLLGDEKSGDWHATGGVIDLREMAGAALSALEQAGYRVVKFRIAKPAPFDFSDEDETMADGHAIKAQEIVAQTSPYRMSADDIACLNITKAIAAALGEAVASERKRCAGVAREFANEFTFHGAGKVRPAIMKLADAIEGD
jgi:hypothetical protein